MIIQFVASDTSNQYDLEWNDAVILPSGTDNWEAILHADCVPHLKCRWCDVGKATYENGVLTIACFKENDILTWITDYFKEHNDTVEIK